MIVVERGRSFLVDIVSLQTVPYMIFKKSSLKKDYKKNLDIFFIQI